MKIIYIAILSIAVISCIHGKVILLQEVESDEIFVPNSILLTDSLIVSGSESGVHFHALDGKLLEKISNETHGNIPLRYNFAVAMHNNVVVIKTFYNALFFLLLFNDGDFIKNKIHHRNIDSIFIIENGKYIVVGGHHYTHYVDYLRKYDEDVENPSGKSKMMFNNFFTNHRAYTLTKYDMQLNLLDSCDIIDKSGGDARAYSDLWSKECLAIDTDENIYVLHRAENYLIRKYNSQFTLLQEIRGDNNNFKPIPATLNEIIVARLNHTAHAYSVVYGLFITKGNNIFIGFHDNSGGSWRKFIKENPQWYFDVYSNDGKKLAMGVTPYRVYTSDKYGNLYFLIKKDSKWPFSADKYYLVSFTLDDLIHDRVDIDYVERAIKEYEEEH